MKQAAAITRIVPFGQQLLSEVLCPGDLAMDLTAGNGYDLLFLWQAMQGQGRVLAFDVQPLALDRSAERLRNAGACVHQLSQGEAVGAGEGVYLALGCHSRLGSLGGEAPKVVIANFGFLPGGDTSLITRTESSIEALTQALELLALGGRIALTLYPGHEGGDDEASHVDALFAALPADRWRVVRFCVANVPHAPFVLVAERVETKKGEKK